MLRLARLLHVRSAPLVLLACVVFAASILYLFPLYWMIVGSLTTLTNTLKVPPDFLPSPAVLDNYRSLLVDTPLPRWFFNSVLVSTFASAGAVITSGTTGYALGVMRFPGSTILFGAVITAMLVPTAVTVIPLYLVMRDLQWIDTYQGVIAPGLAYSFGVFLVRQFTHAIPAELLDAARVDGASEVGVFRYVVAPLLRPVLAAVGVFAFFGTWNDFFWQLVVINSDELKTLPVGLGSLVFSYEQINLGAVMAGATIAFIPLLVAFLLLQRHFMEGVSAVHRL